MNVMKLEYECERGLSRYSDCNKKRAIITFNQITNRDEKLFYEVTKRLKDEGWNLDNSGGIGILEVTNRHEFERFKMDYQRVVEAVRKEMKKVKVNKKRPWDGIAILRVFLCSKQSDYFINSHKFSYRNTDNEKTTSFS